jgi:hypothetical protein
MPRSASRSSVAVAQRKPEIQPDGVLDDVRREAVAAVADAGHPRPYPAFRDTTVNVTAPRGSPFPSGRKPLRPRPQI